MKVRSLLRRTELGLPFLLAAISVAGYLLVSDGVYRLGFPLDDAWIHQTYARNLIELGEWAYVPGEVSGGSTSPLWTFTLALGNLLRVDPKAWTYLVGLGFLGATSMVGSAWLKMRNPESTAWTWLIMIGLIYEWHLAWAAVSGMETLAVAFVVVLVFYQLERGANPIGVGALIGVGVWLRPGGLTLFLPAAMYGFTWSKADIYSSAKWLAKAALGFTLVAVPYLLFNSAVAGTILPNTFFAKQAEYAVLQERSVIGRFLDQWIQPLTGIGIVLVPGMILGLLVNRKGWNLARFAPIAWVIVYLGSYALRLPVTYQHGRYAIPTIPVLLLLGVDGFLRWADLNSPRFWKRFLSRTWLILAFVILGIFWGIGARAYGRDVAIIETEMVNPAKWIAEHTDNGALIAAHDIGALGYYGQRQILDLAGLVSPEVIPIIRDEVELANYIQDQEADYLMTFPGWYPYLSAIGIPVYQSDGNFSPDDGGENMQIYRWP